MRSLISGHLATNPVNINMTNKTSTQKINISHSDDVMVIEINNPPINAGSLEVRAGLLAAISEFSKNDSSSVAVIIGAGTTFIAGSDIKEFSAPLQDPQLPAVIAAIENCVKPVVCALHGSALGGGFELALSCDARIALAGTYLGLPEVTLGIIPGAGGTQRLPRLTGLVPALELAATGRRIGAQEALQLGIIDQVVGDHLLDEAIAFAKTRKAQKRRVRDLPAPSLDSTAFDLAKAKVLKLGKNRPAIHEAIASVLNAVSLPIDQGLQIERTVFQTLRVSEEAAALRHQFFAERKVFKQISEIKDQPATIQKVAVIGSGTMGSGIAMAALSAGYQVLLLDQNEQALAMAGQRIQDFYEKQVQSKKVDAAKKEKIISHLSLSSTWSDIADADLVIEAVFEDIAVKAEVFKKIETVVKGDAILATNTSYLSVDVIAKSLKHPERLLGLHFFSPAQIMKLIEVVDASATSKRALATGLAFAKKLNKLPIMTKDSFGFVGNRIYAAYRRQCEFMLEEGAYPHEIDAALEEFGFAMGPFQVADMSGLDIAWKMRLSQAANRNPQHRYVSIPDQLCEAGRLGRKTSAGYYTYLADGTINKKDEFVTKLIDECSRHQGIQRRLISKEEIQKRVLLTMFNEATLLLSEKVVAEPSDCDVVLVNGYGFPRWRGGVIFWAQQQGLASIQADLDWLAKLSGPGFVSSKPDFLF